jgi:hypothetical protein
MSNLDLFTGLSGIALFYCNFFEEESCSILNPFAKSKKNVTPLKSNKSDIQELQKNIVNSYLPKTGSVIYEALRNNSREKILDLSIPNITIAINNSIKGRSNEINKNLIRYEKQLFSVTTSGASLSLLNFSEGQTEKLINTKVAVFLKKYRLFRLCSNPHLRILRPNELNSKQDKISIALPGTLAPKVYELNKKSLDIIFKTIKKEKGIRLVHLYSKINKYTTSDIVFSKREFYEYAHNLIAINLIKLKS